MSETRLRKCLSSFQFLSLSFQSIFSHISYISLHHETDPQNFPPLFMGCTCPVITCLLLSFGTVWLKVLQSFPTHDVDPPLSHFYCDLVMIIISERTPRHQNTSKCQHENNFLSRRTFSLSLQELSLEGSKLCNVWSDTLLYHQIMKWKTDRTQNIETRKGGIQFLIKWDQCVNVCRTSHSFLHEFRIDSIRETDPGKCSDSL